MLPNIPEEHGSHLLSVGSLKSHILVFLPALEDNIMRGQSQKTVEHADSGFKKQRAEKKTKLPQLLGRTYGV
jgi:hypothetical protein